MKKLCLLLTGMLFFAALPLYAQITLQVNWEPIKSTNPIMRFLYGGYDNLAKDVPMGVYIDDSEVFTLRWKESKEITLPSGSYTFYVRMKGGSFPQPEIISFSASSGRVVFRATPISGWSANRLELVQVTPSSQPQSVTQQPQTNQQPATPPPPTAQSSQPRQPSPPPPQNQQSPAAPQSNTQSQQTEQLTYYVKGNARTANVVFFLNQENRFFMDDGGNIVRHSRYQLAGENWDNWQDDGIVQRQSRLYTGGVYGAAVWLVTVSDFYSAIEQTIDGKRCIAIYQKHGLGTTSGDEFYRIDDRYVYTLLKIYERR